MCIRARFGSNLEDSKDMDKGDPGYGVPGARVVVPLLPFLLTILLV